MARASSPKRGDGGRKLRPRPRVVRGRVVHRKSDGGGRNRRVEAAEPKPASTAEPPTRIQPTPKEVALTAMCVNMPIVPLNIRGYGKVSFPIYSEDVLGSLRKVMTKSKFGQGAKDIYDEKVRVSWELKADRIAFANPAWDHYLKYTIMPDVVSKLGCNPVLTVAVLDKFLLYEKGSFFLKHVDKVKEPGNFATLVIQLPSEYTGGHLICEHKKMDKMICNHSSEDGNFEKQFFGFYTAFYHDVEHEVSKVITGIRSCLVYRLVDTSKRDEAAAKPKPKPKPRVRRIKHYGGRKD